MDDELLSLKTKGDHIKFVTIQHRFMREAKAHALQYSRDMVMPNASIIVRDGRIIGRGANGSEYHQTHGCERVRHAIPTGQGYELCEGCHPKNHSEQRAIRDILERGFNPKGSDLYLWGHWWLCRWCFEALSVAGIVNVYFLKNSHVLFNKNHPRNVIGRQFNPAKKKIAP